MLLEEQDIKYNKKNTKIPLFLTKVDNKDQTELNIDEQSIKFKPLVGKVKKDQTTGELTIICPKKSDVIIVTIYRILVKKKSQSII